MTDNFRITDEEIRRLLVQNPDKVVVQFNVPEIDIGQDLALLIRDLTREYERVRNISRDLARDYDAVRRENNRLRAALAALSNHVKMANWVAATALVVELESEGT